MLISWCMAGMFTMFAILRQGVSTFWPDGGARWKVKGSPELLLHAEGNRNVCAKFCDNSFNSCQKNENTENYKC